LHYGTLQAVIIALEPFGRTERIYAADFIGVGPSGAVRTKPQVKRAMRQTERDFAKSGNSLAHRS